MLAPPATTSEDSHQLCFTLSDMVSKDFHIEAQVISCMCGSSSISVPSTSQVCLQTAHQQPALLKRFLILARHSAQNNLLDQHKLLCHGSMAKK
jgi:hypothetical protein